VHKDVTWIHMGQDSAKQRVIVNMALKYDVLLTVHLSIFISAFKILRFADRASQYIYLSI